MFLTVETLDYTNIFIRFLFCYRFFFCVTSKIATKHQSIQKPAQSRTVHIVHYLKKELVKVNWENQVLLCYTEKYM